MSIRILTLLLCSFLFSAPSFVLQPAMVKDTGTSWKITFELSEATDVEVSIIDLRDSSVIRHLAAGVLGANAPLPLQPAVLKQQLFWNGLNDAGAAVSGASPSLRVRAGMKARFSSVTGDNPYRYLVDINGMALDKEGNLFVLGNYSHLNLEGDHGASVLNALRKYSPEGVYQKTIYPLPAGTPMSTASPYGVLGTSGTDWRPITTYLDGPKFGDATAPITGVGALLINEFRNGELLICNDPYLTTKGGVTCNNTMNWMTVDTTGKWTIPSAASFISSPPLPFKSQYSGPWLGGPMFVTPSPNGKYYLVSAIFQTDTSYIGTAYGHVPTDTGFWRDGRIFKVDRTTGVATPWLSLDSIPRLPVDRSAKVGPGPVLVNTFVYYMSMFGSIHGTAMDDSGHVFVCDRLHQRLSVYDTNATLLGFIPVDNPDMVLVNRKNGSLYVFSRNITGYNSSNGWQRYVTLRKYDTWRNNPQPVITLNNFPQKPWGKFYAILNDFGTKPLLWVSSFGSSYDNRNPQLYGTVADTQNGIWALRDDGDKFTVVKSFSAEAKNAVRGFDRIAVDRKTDRVYVNDSWHGLYKIENWASPSFVRCSTSLGKCLDGIDAAVGYDGYLYTREGGCCSQGGHFRYTQDHRHAPVNFPNGKHKTSNISGHHEGGGAADRGLDITPSGQVGYINRKSNGINYSAWCPVPGDTAEDTLLSALPELSGGFQWGPDGNAYIGVLLRDAAHVVPSLYTNDWGYKNGVGAIIKVAKGAKAWVDSGSMQATARKAHNVITVYKTGLAPYNGGASCVCRSPRFDVDPYGRIFIPNAVTGKVTVIDNNENSILSFGDYGNTDSRGPGSMVPSPEFPILWPTGVATSENYIYVTDMGNERLVRVQMDFILDNMPGLGTISENVIGKIDAANIITVTPNPLHPACVIKVVLPVVSEISLTVFDLAGKEICHLSSGEKRQAGTHSYKWDSSGNASGVYFIKLTAGKYRATKRIVITR
ncbi:MAG: T9SS type A sorting domain-containing protein [Fibrobacteres bacterium]|nr:T9SS type A sorting domain-containing protein [Fibrobacterota bacterium]